MCSQGSQDGGWSGAPLILVVTLRRCSSRCIATVVQFGSGAREPVLIGKLLRDCLTCRWKKWQLQEPKSF